MRYFVKVGSRELEVIVDGDGVKVDGEVIRARVEEVSGAPVRLLIMNDAVHRLMIRRTGKGRYDIAMDGYRFDAEALDERAKAIRELSGAGDRPTGPAPLVAPMPGLLVRVNVQEGEAVRAGQGLVVMEAMKMENELRATANGTVKRIAVAPGSVVEKGALLLELE